MTPEEKQRIEQIRERHLRVDCYKSQMRTDIDFLLSLVKSQEAVTPPAEELTAASVLDQSLNTLNQIRDLTASSRSYVPQNNAAEMMLRLEQLGFGSQTPRRGNTLWAMVMDAADEIEQLRKTDAAASMRSACVEKVKTKAKREREFGAEYNLIRAVAFDSLAVELESLSIEKPKE